MKSAAGPMVLHLTLLNCLSFHVVTFSHVSWQNLSSHLGRRTVSSKAGETKGFHPLLIDVTLFNISSTAANYSI